MDCREVRDLADAYVSEQVLVETARAIVAHLDRCPTCHAEVDGLRRLRASVRSAYLASTDLSPSPAFAVALRSRLRSEGLRGKARAPWRRGWLALAATLVLVAGGGFGIRGLGVSGFTAILQAAVGDHRFCLVAFKLAERPIALEKAAALYGDPVDRSLDTVQAPSTQLSGGPVRIVERHSCVFGGRRFAHIVLRYKRDLISLVVTPDERLLRNLPGASVPRDGSIVSLPPVEGYHVAAFRGPRHVVFAISGLDDHDLREVTRSMVGSVSRALRD
jgi:Putative zinc-finger